MGGYKTYADYPADNCTLPAAEVNEFNMKQVMARFATTASRDALILTPEHGQVCYCDDTGETYEYNDSTTSWIGARPRTVTKLTDDSLISQGLTYHADSELQMYLEGGSRYLITYNIMYTSSATADIDINGSYSGNLTDYSDWGYLSLALGNVSGTNTNFTVDTVNIMSGGLTAGGMGVSNVVPILGHGKVTTDTAGTYAVRFKQHSSEATYTRFKAGSTISFLKVG